MQIQKNKNKKPICQHFGKLTKKQISDIIESPPEFMCVYHSKIQNSFICLHCNKMFCGRDIEIIQKDKTNKESCIQKHRRQNKGNFHFFSINIDKKKFNIFCFECWANIQEELQKNNQQKQSSQQYKKLQRFLKVVQEMFQKIKLFYQQQKKNAFIYRGLNNLGNTCFLNVVLQSLNYSQKIKQLYKSYVFNSTKSINSSTKYKYLSKQIQFFYDELLQKVSQNAWHVVKNKKNYFNFNYINQNNNKKLIKKVQNCNLNKIFKQFLEQLQKIEQQPFSPLLILQEMAKLDQKYNFNQEQDAEETLLFFIDVLIQGQLLGFGYQLERYNKIAQHLGKQKISPLQRLVGTYLVSQIYCKQCKKVNLTFDLTYHLSISIKDLIKSKQKNANVNVNMNEQLLLIDLKTKAQYLQKQKQYYKPLRYPQQKTLLKQNNESQTQSQEFLGCFFKQETLSKKENYYECSNCPSLIGSKKFYLVDLPQILIISIKRFDHKMSKNVSYVQFPQVLNLRSFCLQQQDNQQQQQQQQQQEQTKNIYYQYQLYGVIVHLGSKISNGHYVCYLKSQNNIWLRISDSLVRKVTWNQVKNQQAYILLYSRKNKKSQ